MSKSLKALQLAQQIAASAPKRITVDTKFNNTTGSNPLAALAAQQQQGNKIDYQIPEALKHIPPFLFQCVPIEKLIRQQPYLDFPGWCAKPSAETHSGAHFDINRPATSTMPSAAGGTFKPEEWTKVASFSVSQFPFYLVGNSQSINDFRIDHPSVSRVHLAIVHHRQGKVCICDMHSSNGTFLNGRQIETGVYVPIADGDQIRLGGSSRVLFLRMKGDGANDDAATTTATTAATENVAQQKQQSVATEKAADDSRRRQRTEDDAAAQQETQNTTAVASSSSAPAAQVIHQEQQQQQRYARTESNRVTLHHLLIKHKDVDGPVSKAPRNKGEQITRSAEDAEATAKMVRNLLVYGSAELTAEQQALDQKHLAEDSPQTLESADKFFEAVTQHSECSTAKKSGLMGEISKDRPLGLDEFERVALHMVPLEVSRVVKTNLGCHILFRMPDK